jgi:hypothetical protein
MMKLVLATFSFLTVQSALADVTKITVEYDDFSVTDVRRLGVNGSRDYSVSLSHGIERDVPLCPGVANVNQIMDNLQYAMENHLPYFKDKVKITFVEDLGKLNCVLDAVITKKLGSM